MTDSASDSASDSATKVIYDGHILRLEILDNKWEVVRHADAVAILALNDQGEMLLVRQFRPAINSFTVEAPAGLIDAGETPEQAAKRELQEEAGLDGDMQLLTRFYASPGFCDEQLFVFAASNLHESRLPMDEDEDIEVLWLPPAQMLANLQSGAMIGSASTVSAALFGLQQVTEQMAGQTP